MLCDERSVDDGPAKVGSERVSNATTALTTVNMRNDMGLPPVGIVDCFDDAAQLARPRSEIDPNDGSGPAGISDGDYFRDAPPPSYPSSPLPRNDATSLPFASKQPCCQVRGRSWP